MELEGQLHTYMYDVESKKKNAYVGVRAETVIGERVFWENRHGRHVRGGDCSCRREALRGRPRPTTSTGVE